MLAGLGSLMFGDRQGLVRTKMFLRDMSGIFSSHVQQGCAFSTKFIINECIDESVKYKLSQWSNMKTDEKTQCASIKSQRISA